MRILYYTYILNNFYKLLHNANQINVICILKNWCLFSSSSLQQQQQQNHANFLRVILVADTKLWHLKSSKNKINQIYCTIEKITTWNSKLF